MNKEHRKMEIISNFYLKTKYQLLINGRQKVEIKELKNPNVFLDYSQTIDCVYENLEDFNPTKKKVNRV